MIDPDDLDTDVEDDEEDDDLDGTGLVKKLRGVNRDQRKRLRDLERQVADSSDAMKRLAFIEADLPDTPQMKFFRDNYKGDFSSDAIRQSAAEYGFLDLDDGASDDVDTIEQMMNASRGAQPTAAPGSDRALIEKMKQVKPGPKAADEVKQLMVDYGRYQDEE